MRAAILLSLITTVAYAQETEKSKNTYTVDNISGKSYKIMYEAKDWTEAKGICEKEGAKLAVPKSQNEFDFIQKLLRERDFGAVRGSYYMYLLYVGINNLENRKIFKNVDGEDINNTGFHTWHEPTENPRDPLCAVMDSVHPGLIQWWCQTSLAYVSA